MKDRVKESVGLKIAQNWIIKVINENIQMKTTVKIKFSNEEIRTLIVTYGENDDTRKEDKNKYFEILQHEIDDAEWSTMIIDLNRKIRNQNKNRRQYMRIVQWKHV